MPVDKAPLMAAPRHSRRRSVTAPVISAADVDEMLKKHAKKRASAFKARSVWAAPDLSSQAGKIAAEVKKQQEEAPLPPLSNHWTRHFLVEYMGCFVSTTLYSGMILCVYVNQNTSAYQNLPVVALTAPFQQSFLFPTPTLFLGVGIGFSYALGLITAPESILNPIFTFCMALFGLRPWSSVLPGIIGQLLGTLTSNLSVYFMARDLNFWSPHDMQSASIFGVTYPPYVPSGPPGYYEGILDVNEKQDWLFPPQWKSTDKHFVIPDDLPCQPSFVDPANNVTMCWPMISPSNGSAFLSSAIFSMLLVLVIIPLFTAQKLSHAANSFAFGLIVMVFVMSGQALGVSNNPGLWFSGAITSVIVGFDTTGENGIFTYHGNYWYVALLAPFVGAFLGGLVLELYGFAIFYSPSNWHCPTHFITAKDFTAPKGSNADDKSAREAASANVHERAYAKLATELSTIEEESDEDDAMDWGRKRNSRGDSF